MLAGIEATAIFRVVVLFAALAIADIDMGLPGKGGEENYNKKEEEFFHFCVIFWWLSPPTNLPVCLLCWDILIFIRITRCSSNNADKMQNQSRNNQ